MQKLIIAVFKKKIYFGINNKSYGYEDLMVSNLNDNDQSKSKPDTTNMPSLKSGKSTSQKKIGQGLKTLMSYQMFKCFNA